MNRNTLNIKVWGILFPFLLFGADIKESTLLKIEAHGGLGSILLQWDLPEEEIITSIRIFRSSDMMSTYKIIDLDGIITDRYLDKDLFSDELYFYRLEMETIDERILSSAHETPAFAKPKDAEYLEQNITELQQSYPVTVSAYLELTDIHEFKSVLIHDYILKHISFNISQIHMLQMYLLMEEIHIESFLNILSIEEFKACQLLFAEKDLSSLFEYFEKAFNEFNLLLRQQILLTPLEWQDEKANLLKILENKFSEAINIYENDEIFLESLPSIRATNLVKDSSGVKIHLHQFEDLGSSVELYMNEESIPVFFENGNSQMIAIPDDWKYVELLIAENVVQTLPILNEEGLLSIAMDDQYLFADEITDVRTMRSIPKQDFQLNEIAYIDMENKLQVEVAGNSDWSTELGLFMNDSLLWEWYSIPEFSVSFIDSNWILQMSNDYNWLHLCRVNENDEWEILESRPLIMGESFFESKVPDLGTWTKLSYSSFGESNDITRTQKTHQLIPEIFALYQNYPNPFNSSTNITFDLLEDANVSLFVADARGRKLKVFLEEIFLESGFYSFDWSGEYQSSGVYFITLQAQLGDYLPIVMSRKMIYLK
jgi:hypothetical protein